MPKGAQNMKLTVRSSNEEFLREFGKRIRETRIGLDMTQNEVAKKAGVTAKTISRIENGEDLAVSTMLNVLRALGLVQNIDALIPEPTARPSMLMANEKERLRVRKKAGQNDSSRQWKWGDEK